MTWTESVNPLGVPIKPEEELRAGLDRVQKLAFVIGIAAMGLCVVVAFAFRSQREPFCRSYLFAFAFWLGLTLGCSAIAMIHNLSGGKWGQAVRRIVEAGSGNMPLMAVLAIPLGICIFHRHIYGWAGQGPDPHLGPHKAIFLTPARVFTRGVIYFAIWIATSFMIRLGSRREEETGRFSVHRVFAGLSAFGLIFYVLSFTGATVDWVMSITPEWYSTMFTLIFLMGHMLSAFSFTALMLAILIRYKPVAGTISKDQFNDVASFMFAFVVLWAYMSFAQMLITWMGNLKSEMSWYAPRIEGGWLGVGVSLMLLQFALPFLILMNKWIKRRPDLLIKVALGIIVMRFVDLLFLIKPSFRDQQVSWMDLVMPFGIGGLFLWGFIGKLKGRPLIPPPLLNEYTAAEAGGGHPGVVGATEYGAAISHRKGPVS